MRRLPESSSRSEKLIPIALLNYIITRNVGGAGIPLPAVDRGAGPARSGVRALLSMRVKAKGDWYNTLSGSLDGCTSLIFILEKS